MSHNFLQICWGWGRDESFLLFSLSGHRLRYLHIVCNTCFGTQNWGIKVTSYTYIFVTFQKFLFTSKINEYLWNKELKVLEKIEFRNKINWQIIETKNCFIKAVLSYIIYYMFIKRFCRCYRNFHNKCNINVNVTW